MATNDYEETGICSICGRQYTHWGNNAWPINDGRCCDSCNATQVVPTRLQNLLNKKKES